MRKEIYHLNGKALSETYLISVFIDNPVFLDIREKLLRGKEVKTKA